MWTNFDHVMLSAIYSECIAIDKAIEDEANAKQNTLSVGDIREGKGASFSNLEDSPITPEQQKRFDEILRRSEERTKKKKSS